MFVDDAVICSKSSKQVGETLESYGCFIEKRNKHQQRQNRIMQRAEAGKVDEFKCLAQPSKVTDST